MTRRGCFIGASYVDLCGERLLKDTLERVPDAGFDTPGSLMDSRQNHAYILDRSVDHA